MKPSVSSTDTSASSRQLQAWRDWLAPMFQISPAEADREFVVRNEIWNLDGILISRLSAPPVRTVRSKSEISKVPIDHWALTYCNSGTTQMRTPKADIHAGAGVPFLWSLGYVSDTLRSSVDRIQLFLPRDAFSDVAGLLDVASGSVLNNPMGTLLGDYLRLLEHHLPLVSDDISPQLGSAVRTMISACIAPSPDRLAMAETSIATGLLERIRKAVIANLRSPSLTPDSLSKLVGMSRSQIYRVLEPHGGAANYIKRKRLTQAYSLLANPDNLKSIAVIAEELCFGDAAGFSRAFRREFGCAPNDVRASVARGDRLAVRSPGNTGALPERFSDLFH